MFISNEKYADGEMHIIGTENYLFEIEFNPYVDEFIVKVSFGIHTEDGDIIYIEDRNNNESNIHRMSESELLEFLKRINEPDPLNIGDTILLKVLEFPYDITLKLVRTLYDGCVKNIFMTKDGDVISGTCFKCADGYRITDRDTCKLSHSNTYKKYHDMHKSFRILSGSEFFVTLDNYTIKFIKDKFNSDIFHVGICMNDSDYVVCTEKTIDVKGDTLHRILTIINGLSKVEFDDSIYIVFEKVKKVGLILK